GADALQLFLSTPSEIRAGRQGRFSVQYTNTGNTDIVAPLLRVTAPNALLRLSEQQTFGGSDLTFLGIAPDGPAGILRPGQRGQVEIDFQAPGPEVPQIDVQLFRTDLNSVIDWAGLKNSLRPAFVPADGWDAVFANLLTDVGTT